MSSASLSFDVKPRIEILAPWSLTRSSISEPDVSLIRRRFYIPDEYQIIVPGPNGRIDKPPDRCLAFHIATLEAGLRFPLSHHVEDIISGLNVCPAQLMPNSYRQIVGFMILMRHFGVDPSFVHFRHLITVASKTGEKGFLSLAPKPKCKLFCFLPSNLHRWKNKFVYIKPPENRPWRVPILWNVKLSKPYVLGSPSWGHDFILNQITLNYYDLSKILKEEVLVLAGLSPAPIETTKSLGMAVRASMVAKAMREQREALLACSQPVVQEPSTGKRARVEDLSGQEVRTVDWVRNAEKIARDMRGSSSKDGENVSAASSVFKPNAGEDTLEKYRYTLRETDQLALVDLSLTKLEDIAAYHSVAINSIIHHLHLRSACLQNESMSFERKLNDVNQKANNEVKNKEVEQSLNDTKHENVLLRKRVEEFQMNRDRENMELFNAGRAAGRQEFVESDEYRSAVKRACEESVRAFLKSNTYAALVAKRAAVYEFDGFEKCRTQAAKLGAFRRKFDLRRLDPFKNGDLEDPVFEDEGGPNEEDEFAKLL